MENRIRYLDGYRGLAILLVILYHAYYRWPELVPYGDRFADFPLFSTGWLGVNLFFMISGFVILMSLDRCSTVGEFLYRRWLRLFPAMLICSLLLFFSADLFSQRPLGSPSLRDLLPGLTFIEPSWWESLLGSPQGYLEGAFWSLYVEVRYYVIAALLYFWVGRKAQVPVLFGLFLATRIVNTLCDGQSDCMAGGINLWLHQLGFQYFGWFAAGASFYLYVSSGERRWLLAGAGIALLSAAFVHRFFTVSTVAAAIIALMFAATVISPRLQSILSNRVLLFFGYISYPLYLLHENLMISMIAQLGEYTPGFLYFLLPVVPVLLLVLLAWLVARYLELPVKRSLRKALHAVFTGSVLRGSVAGQARFFPAFRNPPTSPAGGGVVPETGVPLARAATRIALLAVLVLVITVVSGQRSATDEAVAPSPADATTPFRNPYETERLQMLGQQAARQPGVQLVFLGDSITQYWERQGREVWEEFYGDRHALNFGVGMAQTGNLLWRIEAGHFDFIEPRLIVLMIGTNNTHFGGHTPPQIAAGVAAVIDALQTRLPETRILLLGIFPRGREVDDPRRGNNEAVNRLLASQADGDRVIFRDISAAFLNPDGSVNRELMKDPVHLNARGYRAWSEAIEADISRLLGEPQVSPAAAADSP